jgi:hypothetical protein
MTPRCFMSFLRSRMDETQSRFIGLWNQFVYLGRDALLMPQQRLAY